MSEIRIIKRDMTAAEIERMNVGFDEHSMDNNVAIQSSERIGYVAADGKKFVGCSSGLAYKNGKEYSGWFYLTDLFVKKEYRLLGVGSKLLKILEVTLLMYDINKIWTWTAGYEGPEFYKRRGYEIFADMKNWYSNGDSRIGLKKDLADL